jgi:hypothetical protein
VAVDEIEAREAVARERHHLVTDQRDQGRRPHRHRAGKGEVMLRHATEMVGATSAPTFSPTPRPIISAVSASVPIRPVGPCCSVEPIGMMMPVLVLR